MAEITLQPISGLTLKKSDGTVITETTKLNGDQYVTVTAKANTGRFSRRSTIHAKKKDEEGDGKELVITQAGQAISPSPDVQSRTNDGTFNAVAIVFQGTANASRILFKPCTIDSSNVRHISSTGYTNKEEALKIQAYLKEHDPGSGTNAFTAIPNTYAVLNESGHKLDGDTTVSVGFKENSFAFFSTDKGGMNETYTYRLNFSVPANTGDKDVYFFFNLVCSGKNENDTALTYPTAQCTIVSSVAGAFLFIRSAVDQTTIITTLSLSALGSNSSFFIDSNTEWTIG